MKKTLKIMSLTLVVVLVIGLLVACGPSTNPVKAKKALENAGYEVFASIASNSDEEKEELDEIAPNIGLDAGDILALIEAGNDDNDEFITIVYFRNSSVAKRYWDEHQEDIEDVKAENKDIDGFEVKKEGSVVYFGTAQAIKDAK